jgi:hypothetical protein
MCSIEDILNRVQNLEILGHKRVQLISIEIKGLKKGLNGVFKASTGGIRVSQKTLFHKAAKAFNQVELRRIGGKNINSTMGLGQISFE